ncbi:imidazole glycerol phosphate synthase subunit HisH [Flavitalea antarctica]
MIGIVNYGMGNLGSVKNALDFIEAPSRIISETAELKMVDKILLPGVGAFGMAMENLHRLGFAEAIKDLVLNTKVPILGVCLGMQLLFESSIEHGCHEGLGLIKGKVNSFKDVVSGLPIPHMGWNSVEFNPGARLFKSIGPSPNMYFVHSYFCKADAENDVSGTTEYGIRFQSSVESGHIFGCQFHPEKSQKDGLMIYKNFNSL